MFDMIVISHPHVKQLVDGPAHLRRPMATFSAEQLNE
jgi:hypothetical protein